MVSAIVGMSEQMVNHYAKEVSKFRLARGAIQLLEAGWGSSAYTSWALPRRLNSGFLCLYLIKVGCHVEQSQSAPV